MCVFLLSFAMLHESVWKSRAYLRQATPIAMPPFSQLARTQADTPTHTCQYVLFFLPHSMERTWIIQNTVTVKI